MAAISQLKVGSTTYDIRSSALPYGNCTTAATTTAKTVTTSGAFTLTAGTVVQIKFTNSNTATGPTLNVNSSGAKAIMLYGTTPAGIDEASSWAAGAIITLTYDGTNWIMDDATPGSLVQIVRW